MASSFLGTFEIRCIPGSLFPEIPSTPTLSATVTTHMHFAIFAVRANEEERRLRERFNKGKEQCNLTK